jgi:ribosome-binding ATPase YchF (GTP1/OBG family)
MGENDPALANASCNMEDFPVPAIDISCRIEAELIGMTLPEQEEFLNDLGVDEPAFRRIIRESFSLLGRISYFTVGEDEVKAWVIPAGSRAPRAAAAIHKDFERGFIKAEVVSYDDFVACGNTLAGAKAAGRLRLEGKDYIVKDGDIVSFRFNV